MSTRPFDESDVNRERTGRFGTKGHSEPAPIEWNPYLARSNRRRQEAEYMADFRAWRRQAVGANPLARLGRTFVQYADNQRAISVAEGARRERRVLLKAAVAGVAVAGMTTMAAPLIVAGGALWAVRAHNRRKRQVGGHGIANWVRDRRRMQMRAYEQHLREQQRERRDREDGGRDGR